VEALLAADRKLAAAYTGGAGRHLVSDSAAKPFDDVLFLKVAALQAWFGQDKELADTRRRVLASAKDAGDANMAAGAARACSIVPSPDRAELKAALALARKAADVIKAQPFF
jgi:hypothetical protein